jgi:2-polyprenyl-3-methyl-5-hydroxy-6-metoxy-1,4-benzoquinol methylase
MQYEPIKRSLGSFFSGPLFLRKTLYLLLDMLLLRSWHVRKELKFIASKLPSDASILDAGSGFGQYTWRMLSRNRKWKADAIDIDDAHIGDCKRFFSRTSLANRVSFSTGDLTKLDADNKYDLILSVDVMEHIEDDVKVFSNFNRALHNGGMLLISTPSDKGGSDVHDHDDKSFIDEHVRDGYNAEEIAEKLHNAGFSSVKTKYTYGKPGNISWRLSMKYPVRMLNISYLFFILLPFYYLIFFPVSVILNFCDLYMSHKSGTGLLVTAIK